MAEGEVGGEDRSDEKKFGEKKIKSIFSRRGGEEREGKKLKNRSPRRSGLGEQDHRGGDGVVRGSTETVRECGQMSRDHGQRKVVAEKRSTASCEGRD